jgi:hypothetical protein
MLLVWVHTHTDEIPFVLGCVVLVAGSLALSFPRLAWLSALATGLSLFIAETLVHFAILPAPYPPSKGLPWPALFGIVPAIMGTSLGYAVRRVIHSYPN